MQRLAKYMLASRSLILFNRKAKPRFFIIIGILIILLIFSLYILFENYTPIWDKLNKFFSRPFVTSYYWKAVLYGD